jgi:prepilin-type N-terminal cleavage/methylation domain-containing protein
VARAPAGDGESGLTLIEVVVTISLLGIAMTAMFALVFTVINDAALQSRVSAVEAEARSWTEKVENAPWEPPCDAHKYSDVAPSAGYMLASTPTVLRWNNDYNPATFGSDCTDSSVEQITATIKESAGTAPVSQHITFVKRK